MRLRCPSWGRLMVVLVILLATLQLLHLILLSRLDDKTARLRHRAVFLRKMYNNTVTLFHSMRTALQTGAILDASGQYRVVPHVFGSSGRGSNLDVTLVSQCSLNHIHHVAHLSKRWPGPVSVALFVAPEHAGSALNLMLWLYHCVPSMRQNVTLHLVFPFSHQPPVIPSQPPTPAQLNCEEGINKMSSWQNYANNLVYPNNLLRNVAWTGAKTGFVLVLDIDMLPSADLYTGFTHYIHHIPPGQSGNHAYVLPAFEIQPHIALPQTKEQLLLLWKQNKLRPFYWELCEKCQRPTEYAAWRQLATGGGGSSAAVDVGYEVAWTDPWEPFFIAPRHAPRYDERFKQYGFNRISQVCELHVAGFKFVVLNSGFVVHKGYKSADAFHAAKDADQERNRRLFRQFKEELKAKYPDVARRC